MRTFFTALYKSRPEKKIRTSNITEPQEDNSICRRTTLSTREKEKNVSLFREDHEIASIFKVLASTRREIKWRQLAGVLIKKNFLTKNPWTTTITPKARGVVIFSSLIAFYTIKKKNT
ncbi:hypothetical protein CDIK_2100 [Cucumispora dikerogammari]|nr:hypothetical protein CDIK_2100 [Cucumispora dikerogammari]